MNQSDIDSLRLKSVSAQNHFIDGGSYPSASDETLEVLSPIDGTLLSTIPKGAKADVEHAAKVARNAFGDRRWAGKSPAERKKVLLKWSALIEKHALELAVLGVQDNGTEISMAIKAEPGSAAATIRYYAEALDKVYGEIAPTADDVLGMIHKEPVGVIGAIIPWNFPMMIGAWKLGPALAMGNSVVLKPSETASLSLVRMVELAHEAGLPEGVLNIVLGEGAIVGEAMGLSMDIDVLVFTGSATTGRRLLQYSAQSNLKRVYLELGGKSPHIVFADTPDLMASAKAVAFGIFRNSGQVCVAGSRLLVEDAIHDELVNAVSDIAQKMKIGDPLQLDSDVGAVNSERQLEQNLHFVDTALSEGGELVTGGKRILTDTGGYYMAPTVVAKVTPFATLSQQEVFGPVLGVSSFSSEADALEQANATVYGLAAGVWTSNLARAHRMVQGIRTGVVHVNTYGGADNTVPLGGVGQSGNGHDKSLHALNKYTELKTAWIKL